MLDPDPNVMPLVPRYQIWFYVPTQEGADLWDKKTKYRPDKLMLNRQELMQLAFSPLIISLPSNSLSHEHIVCELKLLN